MLGEQIEALRGHAWPAGARRPVAGLVEDLEDAREEWRKASTAGDADTYYTHYDKAYGFVDGRATVTARKASDWRRPRRSPGRTRAGTPKRRCDGGHSGEKPPA
ncbi:hypothetical protein RFN58_27670 [Streptomyces iakyrus]|uniref:hypothetical protein n=1 Tax=Streptomyces iakyrus TaxID=68219 RepID=UPI0006921739|nr:hypothetical protein [Streptomyces iakyrus]